MSTQMLISGAMLLVVVAIVVFTPDSLTQPTLFSGVLLVFVLSGVAATVPWDRISRNWRVLLPVLNIVAIGAIRAAEPSLGSGLLLVFPVIWLARSFPLREVVAGTSLAVGIVWLSRAIVLSPLVVSDFTSLVLLPITLVFVATIGYIAARRGRAQSVLLRQHSQLIETALERARLQQRLLDEVLNTVDFGVISFDRNRQVTLVNRTQRRWLDEFGEPRTAFVHEKVYLADRATLYAEGTRPFSRALAGQEFDNLVIWVGEPGGRRAAYTVSSRVLRDERGEYDGGVVVVKDVTRELEAVRARDDLVGSVTHELRSPLTSILGYLDLIRDADLDGEALEHVEVAYNNAERLLVIVNDLLRAASDADKNLPMSFVRADVAQIARESVASHQLFADDNEVELRIEAPGQAWATIDPVRVRQVIDNLVTNAIKYNREWGEVAVSVREADHRIWVEVRDSGQGIPESDVARIFDRFYRTKSARNSTTTGTGLGLAITREIIQRHGGDLSVESELGIGSTFRVTLPVEHVAQVDPQSLPGTGGDDSSSTHQGKAA
ncbi:sensor histidine kinase [Mesorhizobium japonicum]|uniref:sensor histidine kinase n=1 Tax=Mesorhizobium japonicum TaxID=2066070 RepID=UPI003B59215C